MGEYLWRGCDILHDGMVLKAVNGVSGFATKAGDVFCRDKLDIKFRFYRSGGPFRGLHGSWEYYFGFCPINGWVMTSKSGFVNTSWNFQPNSAEFHRIPSGSIKFPCFSLKSVER